MEFYIVTLFPDMIHEALKWGVLGQGLKQKHLQVHTVNPRDFTQDPHRKVDDRPYGGGDGMVLMAQPLDDALESLSHLNAFTVCLSPQGQLLSDAMARQLAQKKRLVLICGRYSGWDQRALHGKVDMELSIGDYVLSGGELPTLVVLETVSRMLKGVLGHKDSAHKESFAHHELLEAPLFTRPPLYKGMKVPEILTSGHNLKKEFWKKQLSYLNTLLKRPELLTRQNLPPDKAKELWTFFDSLSEEEKDTLGLKALSFESFQPFL